MARASVKPFHFHYWISFMAASRSHRRRIAQHRRARFSNTAAAATKLHHHAHFLFSASLKLASNNRVIMSSASFCLVRFLQKRGRQAAAQQYMGGQRQCAVH
jgi:hypothetical protein